MINTVQIQQLDEVSILPILEGDPRVESEGSTKTITVIVTNILAETPSPPRCLLGELFLVSYDSPPLDRETNS